MDMKDRIAFLKEKYGMTTDDLSVKSGIPVGTINKILNGETPNPRLDTSKALAAALNCTLDYLTGETEYQNSRLENETITPEIPDIITLQRGMKNMSPEDRKKLIDMARVMFEKAFEDGDDDIDV